MTEFHTRNLLKETNAMIITLVPKKPNPSLMGYFLPISCCNVMYKCTTKILANMILPCLDSMVGHNQTVFVPNRSIAENVLLAGSRVSENYHREQGRARCTLKLDLMKAYVT
jgi:hypothetical protein